MRILTLDGWLRKQRTQLGLLLAALLAFAGGFLVAQAQGAVCQDMGGITVCADQIQGTAPAEVNASGTITIALKGKQPYLVARPFEGRPARFFLGATFKIAALAGAVGFVNDPQAQPLVSAKLNADGSIKGYLELDIDTGNATEAQLGLPGLGFPTEADFVFNYIDRAGIRTTAKNGQVSFEGSIAKFLAQERRFEGRNFVDLKLDGDENPDIRISVLTKFSETGQISGTIGDFKARLAGLQFDLKEIKLGQDPTTKKTFFEIAKATALKADNPGVPGLTNDATAIFVLEKLRYQEGRFSFSAAEVPIPDWKFGNAFQLVNQRIGVSFDETNKTALFTVKSTLKFIDTASGLINPFTGEGTGSESTNIPVVLRIGGARVDGQFKPVFQAGLQDLTVTLGKKLQLKLKGTVLTGDTVQNFFGLQAQSVDLKWPSALGGQTSAGLTGFKVGVDKDLKAVFALAGGSFQLPPLKSGVLEGSNLAATVSVVEKRVELQVRGNGKVNLPGNSGVAPTIDLFLRSGEGTGDGTNCKAPNCLQRFEMKLAGFGFKLAGFELTLTKPRGTEDGGFAADTAALKVPLGINLGAAGAQVNGITVAGNGKVTIAGGGFELPPLEIAGFQFVALRGSFVQIVGGYEFQAGGTFPLPGLEPSTANGGKKIAVDVKIRTEPDGSFRGFGVKVFFSARPGIPVSGIPAELTSIGGEFDLNSGSVQIGASMRFESSLRLIGIPVASVDGSSTLKLNPFKITANAQLSVLIFNVASAGFELGDGAGFSGGKGFNASFQVNGVIVKGSAKLRIGKLVVNGENKTRLSLSAGFQVGLKKGQFGFLLPPFDINIASLNFQGGQFQDRRDSPTRTTGGMLGTVSVGPFDGSLFVDLGRSGPKVDLVNANKFTLIDSVAARRRAALGEPGYGSRRLGSGEVARLGLSSAPGAVVLQDSIPIVVTSTSTLVAGINYPSGTPSIRLRLPDGTILTEQTVVSPTQAFVRNTQVLTEGNDLAFILKNAPQGTYTLLVDNAPTKYTKVSYLLNAAPTVSNVQASCGGTAVSGVTVNCAGVSGGAVSLSWTAADADSPEAKVRVGYVALPADGSEPDPGAFQQLAEELPLGAGSFSWPLDEVPTGKYRLVVRAEDESNAPTDALSALVIEVDDKRPPALPSGLQAVPQPGELLVTWTPGSEKDLAGYEIGFGVVQNSVADSADNFVYKRDMGAKEVSVTAGNLFDARLWGLKDNEQVFVGIRAYDLSGNRSPWSQLLRAKPWALAPKVWTPIPDGTLPAGKQVEVAFDSPLDPATVTGTLQVRRANGSLIPGSTETITNLDGDQIIGLRFTPSAPLTAGETLSAVLVGGANGLKASDGRTLAEDYAWNFSVTSDGLFLPMVMR